MHCRRPLALVISGSMSLMSLVLVDGVLSHGLALLGNFNDSPHGSAFTLLLPLSPLQRRRTCVDYKGNRVAGSGDGVWLDTGAGTHRRPQVATRCEFRIWQTPTTLQQTGRDLNHGEEGQTSGGDGGTDTSTSSRPKAPVIVKVAAREALNGVIVTQQGMSYADANSIVKLRAALARKTPADPWTRLNDHTVLEKDSWLKFFPQPQRFPACNVDWNERVLHRCDKYIIIDKPPCLPCQGVESNGLETAPNCAAKALSTKPLILAHRLDCAASGVLVLARTRAAQSLFTRLLGDGKVVCVAVVCCSSVLQ